MSFLLSSAPSPTFSLFSWHTCLLGVASCLLMMFLISPGAAGGSLLLMGLLCALLTARGGPSSWGYVSQALLFHQVWGAWRRVGGEEAIWENLPSKEASTAFGWSWGFCLRGVEWGLTTRAFAPHHFTFVPRCANTCSGWMSGRST